MHDFNYVAPTSIGEAVAVLKEQGANARLLAGGTDLLINMRVGRRKPAMVVDGKGIAELNELKMGAKGLTIGAAVSCKTIYENDAVARDYPALIDSVSLIGGIQIQGRASLGGNLCNAAPSGDAIPTLMVLGAIANVIGPNGERQIPVDKFCTGPGKSALSDNELLVSIFIPAPVAGGGAFFLRFIPRNEMDIAVVNAAVAVVMDGDTVKSARIAIGSCAPTPLLATEAGALLAGNAVSDGLLQRVGDAASDATTPISDMRGTAKYRKHLARVLTKRAVLGAIDRARGV